MRISAAVNPISVFQTVGSDPIVSLVRYTVNWFDVIFICSRIISTFMDVESLRA